MPPKLTHTVVYVSLAVDDSYPCWYCFAHALLSLEEQGESYMLGPVNKTDHMQQGTSVLAQYH